MPKIFRYFWFIAAVIMLINVSIWRRRLAPLVDRGTLTKREVDGFLRGATIWLVGGSLVAGLIGLFAHWPSPFCAGMLSFADLPSTLTSVLAIAGWVALVWWMWRGGGAEFVSRAAPALARRPPRTPPSPTLIRLGATALVIMSAVVAPIMWRQMPSDPSLACPARGTPASPTAYFPPSIDSTWPVIHPA